MPFHQREKASPPLYLQQQDLGKGRSSPPLILAGCHGYLISAFSFLSSPLGNSLFWAERFYFAIPCPVCLLGFRVTNLKRLDKKIRSCHIERGLILTVASACEVCPLKILIIEDDVNIARLIELELGYEGYQVSVAHDGNQGLDLFKKDQPDLVLLDVMLPGLDGIEVCKRLRGMSKVPVIMLTAKDGVQDRVSGLDSGADDYLTKPFATEELLARIRAVMRRKPQEGILTYADLWMDQLNRVVKRGERQLDLRAKEFDLLRLFMQYPEQVLSREFIFDKVWGYDFIGESNVIEVYIRYLRSKLEDASSKRLIQTVRGEGYVLREEEPSR